jgi:hypothetical protein
VLTFILYAITYVKPIKHCACLKSQFPIHLLISSVLQKPDGDGDVAASADLSSARVRAGLNESYAAKAASAADGYLLHIFIFISYELVALKPARRSVGGLGRRPPTLRNKLLDGVLARVCRSWPHLQDNGEGGDIRNYLRSRRRISEMCRGIVKRYEGSFMGRRSGYGDGGSLNL